MKVDVVACYYRQAHLRERFWRGIRENADSIRAVIVSCDEPVNLAQIVAPDGHASGCWTALGHEHNGYGIVYSLNEGIAETVTPYVFVMGFDMILPRGFLAARLTDAAPGRLSCGPTTIVAPGDEWPPVELRPAFLNKTVAEGCRICRRQWRYVSGHYLLDRSAHDALGGFDPAYAGAYGAEDYDYGARWMMRFGDDAVHFSDHLAWHVDSKDHSKLWSLENSLRLVKTLRSLYGDTLVLFSDCQPKLDPMDGVRVSEPRERVFVGGFNDVFLPCVAPNWASAFEWSAVHTCLPNPWIVLPSAVLKHVRACLKLAPITMVHTGNPNVYEHLKRALSEALVWRSEEGVLLTRLAEKPC